MGGWTHVICEPCWTERNPERVPVRLKARPVETCCFCGGRTTAGIYLREDPKLTRCSGKHEVDR